MPADFLLELLSEEIPARMQARACDDLARLFAAELAKADVAAGAIETHATPRRLALIARALPETTEAIAEEIKGPRASAPPQALDGFLRKTGLARDDLIERDGVFFATIRRPGRAMADVLGDAIPAIVRAFPWPKSMRWGAASASTASLRWVRPLRGIVALFGEDVVGVSVDGIVAGAATVGHRFHHPGIITIGSAADYAEKLRLCHVIVDAAERQAIVRDGSTAAAAAGGIALVPDEGLVAENAGLTEWPVPLLGHFDPAFLAVPREVIQLTMRTNQKYFACVDAAGAIAPAFVCTANIDAADGGAAIVAGNEKVLAARLADARFFWEQDLKVPLAEQARKLDRIVFHEKLGTVADKAARVAKLARWLAEEGIVPGCDPALAEQAGLLCKADLVTGMVGEFPELQGIIGGYYARAEGRDPQVAAAIRDHYSPVGQGDEVPTAPVTVAVSLADKLDSLFAFFSINEKPSGSKDPFALRRAALGVLSLIVSNSLRLRLLLVFVIGNLLVGRTVGRVSISHFPEALRSFEDRFFEAEDANQPFIRRSDLTYVSTYHDVQFAPEISVVIDLFWSAWASPRLQDSGLLTFLIDRLKVQQREAGVRHDLIDAVFALGGEDDLVRLLARVHALQAFIATEDGANLLAGYRRAANILRIEEKRDAIAFAPVDALNYVPLPAEALLLDALGTAEQAASEAVAAEDFAGAMQALAALRPAIDAFFDAVTVNDDDGAKRTARLGLLARIRDAVHRVADFSRIEG